VAIDPSAYDGGSLLDYVEAAVEGMKDDLEPGDLAIVGVIKKSAMAWDLAVADGKPNSAMAFLAYVMQGIEKLGGSALARKQLGKKQEKPKSSLAAVRELHGADSAQGSKTRKPRTTRASKAKGA
jgi:hypothetical protein